MPDFIISLCCLFRGRITHKNVYRLMCDMSPPVGFGRKCPRFLAYKVRHWISFCVVSQYCIRCIYNVYTVMTSWCLLVGCLAAGGGSSVEWLVMERC